MFRSANVFGIPENDFHRLQRWRISTFFVMLIGYVGYYIVRQNLSVAFKPMEIALGYTNTELGMIAGISELAYAVGKFINGPLADKVGGRKMFLLGLAGAILANLAFAVGDHLWWFIVVWCICRYFLAMGWGGLAKVIGNWFEPEKNGTVMGWISINFQFGGVVAGAIAGLVLAWSGRWQDVFIYPAIVGTIVLFYSYFASRDKPSDVVPETKFGKSPTGRRSIAAEENLTKEVEKEPIFTTIRNLLSISLFRHVLVFSFLTTFLRSVFVLWAPKLLIDIGLGQKEGVFKALIFPALGCIGTILLGWYTDRYAKNGDRARMMWIMLVGLTVCLLMMYFTTRGTDPLGSTALSTVVFLLGLSGFFLYGPYSMSSGSLTLDIAGAKAAGTCTGLIDGLGYVGGAIAAFSAGYVSQHFGWSAVMLGMSAFALLSTLSAWRMSVGFQRRAQRQIKAA